MAQGKILHFPRSAKVYQEEFLDIWFGLYPKLYRAYHKMMGGDGLAMMTAFEADNTKKSNAVQTYYAKYRGFER